MTNQQQQAKRPDKTSEQRGQQNALVGKHVLGILGLPERLHSVQVRWLWDAQYRVNIFVGGDAVTAKIAHSFFLEAGTDGSILASNPKITRQYEHG